MKKKFLSKEFVIGISVIVALVILFLGIDYLKGINFFNPANSYHVYYDNVEGLSVAAPVKINGYKVGQVREIHFPYDKPGKIDVLLALDEKLHVPEGTKALITGTLLSGSYVELSLGHGLKDIKQGGEIIAGSNADLMTAISETVLPAVNDMLPKIDSLLTSINRVVSDPALPQAIGRFDGITNQVYLASVGLNNTLNRDVPAFMVNARHAAVNLDTICANLSILSAQLRTLPLQPTMENVNQITENLQTFSRQLNDQKSTLGLLMNDPALYYKLDRVAADVDSLVLDIKKNPKRYISIKLL